MISSWIVLLGGIGFAFAKHFNWLPQWLSEDKVAKWIEGIALVYAIIMFFFWLPFRRDENRQREINEIKTGLAKLKDAPLEIVGISHDITTQGSMSYNRLPTPWNCLLKITNKGHKTAENIQVELTGISFEEKANNFMLPAELRFQSQSKNELHPSQSAIVELAHAEYALKPNAIIEARIRMDFGRSGMHYLFSLFYKIEHDYFIQVKASAKDLPVSEACFNLRFLHPNEHSWVFTLTQVHDASRERRTKTSNELHCRA